MYLFTGYVFGESVDSAHISQISSTFQEADCLLKLVTINKQVFAITSLSRNSNHTAQLSISAKREIINLSVGLGGNNGKDPTSIHVVFPFWTADATEKGNWVFSVSPPPLRVEAVAPAISVLVFIHWIRVSRVSRQCTQFTKIKYLPRSWLLAEAS